jgi:hypothetical protein
MSLGIGGYARSLAEIQIGRKLQEIRCGIKFYFWSGLLRRQQKWNKNQYCEDEHISFHADLRPSIELPRLKANNHESIRYDPVRGRNGNGS